MSVAEILLDKRYPEDGFEAVERISDTTVRVFKGQAWLVCEGRKIIMARRETVMIPKNTPYCWIPDGKAELFIVNSPPWTEEQHEIVPAG
jgi:mannose-6-phosphate isomerase-like protein (cupin superfamily)